MSTPVPLKSPNLAASWQAWAWGSPLSSTSPLAAVERSALAWAAVPAGGVAGAGAVSAARASPPEAKTARLSADAAAPTRAVHFIACPP